MKRVGILLEFNYEDLEVSVNISLVLRVKPSAPYYTPGAPPTRLMPRSPDCQSTRHTVSSSRGFFCDKLTQRFDHRVTN